MTGLESFDDAHTIVLVGEGPATARRVLKVGDVVGGQYKIKSLLGHGGMGYVFCAEHTMMRSDYALKILAPEQLNDESRERFAVEARAIAKLDQPKVTFNGP